MPLSDVLKSRPAGAPHGPGFLPMLLAGLVMLAALVVTYAVAENGRRVLRADLRDDFDYGVRDVAGSIVRRLTVYDEVLLATCGFLRGSVEVSDAEFAAYFAQLRLAQRFPSIGALGIATVPPGRLDAPTTITHILPLDARNLRAVGYDMYGDPVRRIAMATARDSGQAAMSGKVRLIQDDTPGGKPALAGFLMYEPVYRAGAPHDTVAQRRAALIGWVYAPFRAADLMRGVGATQVDNLEVEIYDGTEAREPALLYRSPGARPATGSRLFQYAGTIVNAGHPWHLVIRSSARLETAYAKRHTTAIVLTGIGLGALLALVVWLLASERRRALQLAAGMTHELRASRDRIDAERERIRLILQNAYDAFVAVDAHGRITDWNVRAVTLFGWREDEAVGRDAAELLLAPERRDAMHACLRAFADGGALPDGPVETLALDRHGQAIPVEVAAAAQPTAHGFGVTAFVRDMRPRRQAEERERRRQQRLDEARDALARSQKLEAVGKMTGGVSHDFNNILHIISANTQLMLRHDDANRKRLTGIMDAVERGRKLAAQLLAFARRQPLHPSVVSIADMIGRMDSLLHRAAGDTVEMRFALPDDVWNALVDPNQLENVLLNLVINARDAMADGGRITIALANLTVAPQDRLAHTGIHPGEFVTVAVSDTGSGMPPEVMERAFEPFFTTKPEGKGTGLGLSMAHGFVKQSGGHIRLASVMGEGTTVTLFLPRALQDMPDPVFAPHPH